MNKEELEWYFKKYKEKRYTIPESDRSRDIEKRFLMEQIGEERTRKIFHDLNDYGYNPFYKCNNHRVIPFLTRELLRKLMEDELNE